MANPMKDIYDKLSRAGLTSRFVKECVLPDWWDDSLAEVPANRKFAELSIAKLLGVKSADVRNPEKELEITPHMDYRLKHAKGASHDSVRVFLAVGEKVAERVRANLIDFPKYSDIPSALEIRERILHNNKYVNLASLVEFCWQNGFIVLHIKKGNSIKGSSFHGVTFFPKGNPVILLAFGSDSPSWLAFHLAHELGHIGCKHVIEGGESLVDAKIEFTCDKEKEEKEANRFAMELLTGKSELQFKPAYGMTAPNLARAASAFGRENSIDPATCVLIYGKSADRWGVAQSALKLMNEMEGAEEIVGAPLLRHLCVGDMPETDERLLTCLSTTVA